MELEKYGLKAQSDHLAGLLDALDIPKITVSSFLTRTIYDWPCFCLEGFLLVGKGGQEKTKGLLPSFLLPKTQASISDERFDLLFSNIHS